MANRTFVISGQEVGNNRRHLSQKIQENISMVGEACAEHNGRIVSTNLTDPQPYGPLGNWAQTMTIVVEGDYDDPKFKELYDRFQNSNFNQPSKSGGCYIATAIYGSYDCPQVWTLRRFRDNVLAKSWYGRAFIRIYYAVSPTLVKWFGNENWFRKICKGKLDTFVKKLQNQGFKSTSYDDKI